MTQADRHGPREFGAALQKARAAAGVSLETISEQTKIGRRVLEAFEAGEFAKLPSRVFARMFIRQIAAILGEEEERWVAALDQAWESFMQGSQVIRVQITTARRKRRVGPWIIGLVLVAGGLTLLYLLAGRRTLAEREEASPPPATILPLLAPTPTQVPAETPTAEPTPPPLATPDPQALVVETANRSCWVQARISGGGTQSRLMLPNSVWEIAAGGREVELVIGNAGAIGRILYLGQTYQQIGKDGEVTHITVGGPQTGGQR
jgi:cytoskeleton protein RodZ